MRDYHVQYTDPIRVRRGDLVRVGRADGEYPDWRWCTAPDGRQAWVPVDVLGPGAADGTTASLLADYDSTELPLRVGDVLVVEHRRSDWLVVVNADGKRGWVPASHVQSVTD